MLLKARMMSMLLYMPVFEGGMIFVSGA